MSDGKVLGHIEELIAEEQRMYAEAHLSDEERRRLRAIEVELDRYWDLLRQRRALRDAGKDPNQAHLRDGGTVEHYQQ
jgi:uncharacterized protein YjaG (DUF416 family)